MHPDERGFGNIVVTGSDAADRGESSMQDVGEGLREAPLMFRGWWFGVEGSEFDCVEMFDLCVLKEGLGAAIG